MTGPDKVLFTNLLFAHKRLLTLYEEIRFQNCGEDMHTAKARQGYFEMTDDVFLPLQLALQEDKPLATAFNAVLSHSNLVESQVRSALRQRD